MKNKIFIISFLSIIYIFMIITLLTPKKEVSKIERRTLATFPKYQMNTEYINKLERYLLDHFPFRETFIKIKTHFNFNILQKEESNDTYIINDYIFKSDYPTNNKSITNYIDYINNIIKDLTSNNNIYLLVVPDKNYFLNDKYLNIDYNYIYNRLYKELDINKIDIRNKLTLDNYYKTDNHWKQETLNEIVKEISNSLNLGYQEENYTKKTYNEFYGVNYGNTFFNQKPEVITYLYDDYITNAHVNYLENPHLHKVYNESKLSIMDSYDVYLDGASSYIEIYNNLSTNNKELIVFRDSFASSIIPLLIKYYSKITVIDNRYISSNSYKEIITYDNQDILFLNSTLLVNSSNTLRN